MAKQEETESTAHTGRTAELVGAIDIGSNSVRMLVAQVLPDGRTDILERLRKSVRLGQDTFRRGRLSGQTMRATVSVLRDFRRILDSYGVQAIRAVATSAVREARNADTFLDRILMATGLDVVVIGTSEESRLAVSAVRQVAGSTLAARTRYALIAEVGGGSTLLTLLKGNEILSSGSLSLGSIRLQEVLLTSYEPPAHTAELLRQQIASEVNAIHSTLPLKRVTMFIAVGSDARFAADQIGTRLAKQNLRAVGLARFDRLVGQCIGHAAEELVRRYGLVYPDAETLNPALLVYQALLHATRARRMIVPEVSMRDGLLLDLVNQVTGQEDESLSEGIIHSATAIAEKYRVDLKHARAVTDLAVRLFDQLQGEHGLLARDRLLLRVAAVMHEVGNFINSRAHHKHSYYLISNSEIFGLTRNELEIVSQVARYHRRAVPKPTHVEYMALPREGRMVVSKLAALLRVADALDQNHQQQVQDIICDRQDEEFTIHVATRADLTLERKSVEAKGDLFEDIYGMRVRLEEG
ncbi:MAG: HD domain-containing protein [Anaerolineaceae bacterium]|nr:HD domain-containing protein [Anaerolineaceae bacterium]